MTTHPITVEVNGVAYDRTVPPRLLLSDFLRHELHLTGTHVGCEHGVCGACTVQLDGQGVRSCLLFAVQADGCAIKTVEGLANGEDLHPLQEAFSAAHALQCGFCTPGLLMAIDSMLDELAAMTEAGIREVLSGNICRCTGYQGTVEAVQATVASHQQANQQQESR